MHSRPSRRIRLSIPWLVTALAVICLGVVFRAYYTEHRQMADLQERLARVRPGVRRPQPADAAGPARRTALGVALTVGTAQAFGVADARDHLDGRRDDPGYALIWHRQQQRIIERQYGYAVAALNLPEATSAKLKELLTARREAVVDARDAAAQVGISGPQVNLAVEQSIDAFTAEIRQLVGEDTYYGELEMAPTISSCKSLLESTLGLDLAAKGDPLTNDQLYWLAKNYVNAAYGPDAPGAAPVSDPGLTPQYQTLLYRVAGNLSPMQVSSLKDFLVEQVQTQRVSGASSAPWESE